MQSIRIEDIKTPPSFTDQKVVKKVWVNPQVTEISKFSILTGIDNSKDESQGPSFLGS